MIYSLVHHGDFLEKHSATFVNTHLCNYENIWKTYIGNIGNQTMPKIKNYDNDKKRQEFWEPCYTVLESSFLAYNIIKSDVFSNPITTFSDYENFNKNFVAFFAHLGRINDNIQHASEILGVQTNKPELKEYYTARHIAVHGKVIPISLDELGLVQIPILSKSVESSFGWTVKSKSWREGSEMTHELVSDTCENLLFGLLNIINGVFANLLNTIHEELKSQNASIQFEYRDYSVNNLVVANSIGSAGSSGLSINVYNIQLPVSQSRDNSDKH